MKTTTEYDICVSREFMFAIEETKTEISFGIDNLSYMIEAIEGMHAPKEQKKTIVGAMWCAYYQIWNGYQEINKLIEAEYDRMRGAKHG